MIQGEDYGVIPRSQSQKPTLLKPGAQKLCGLFGLAPTIKKTERVFKEDLIAYEVHYQVVSKESGVVEGEGLGMCNSRERKYAKQDQYEIANTILKMAGKRALIDATLNALGISSLFTQDIEEMDFGNEPAIATPTPPSHPLATSEQIGECEALRQQAVKLGFRAAKGVIPARQELGAEERRILAKSAAFQAFIQKHGDKAAGATVPPPGEPPTARFDALQDLGGLSRFIAATTSIPLAFSNDDDIAAFENAATPKTNIAVIAENLSDDDWHGWAAMVENEQLTWEVGS